MRLIAAPHRRGVPARSFEPAGGVRQTHAHDQPVSPSAVARAGSGAKRRSDRKPVDLPANSSKSLTDQMVPVAESRGVRLLAEYGDRSIRVMGDAGWLERVILNLIDNAIKFTRAGGDVEVKVQTSGDDVILEVRDTGEGIQPDVIPRIFERFYQADPARTGGDGAGLGLSLVKWAVDQHGGKIEVTSEPGQGSLFRVFLPKIKGS